MKLIDLKNNCSTSNTYIASTLHIIILNLYEQTYDLDKLYDRLDGLLDVNLLMIMINDTIDEELI